MGTRGPMLDLVGRAAECRMIESLLKDTRAGSSRALVVRGEPGVGKTALLDHAIASASGFQLARSTGVESEMELAFAGLHQLCAPLLNRLGLLPGPQREAISTAFGLSDGKPPDRFLIGLALLGLLTETSEHTPLLCVVDDSQWLDRSSAHALAFVARRLMADRVFMLFATRHSTEDLHGLPELVVEGLGAGDANALLASVLRAPLDERVRDQIVAETRGNPLALLEWPRGLNPNQLAGGFGTPTAASLAGQIEESFRRRLDDLPPATRRFLVVAAAEPTGDPVLVWRAASRLSVGGQDVSPAIEAGLVEIGSRVWFRHPTVRSAVYQAATIDHRQDAHRALAAVIDPVVDPERRAWHRALAAPGPDEEVAAELERSATRAQGRGGLAAAAALLERSALLSLDPARRAERMIAAGGAHIEAGAPNAAAGLLAAAEAGPLDALHLARVEILRGNAAVGWGDTTDGPELLLRAARRLEPLDVRLARDTYFTALLAADLAGEFGRGATVLEVARAARAAPAPPSPGHPHDLLLEGLAVAQIAGPAAAAPILREALNGIATVELSPGEAWWVGHAMLAARLLWDYNAFYSLAMRRLQAARELGALRMLPWTLDAVAHGHLWVGNFAAAASLVAELESLIEAMGSNNSPWVVVSLAAWRGHEDEARSAIDVTIEQARARRQGHAIKVAHSAEATLFNGLGRYEDALIAAERATRLPVDDTKYFALPELVEAAVRSGRPAVAANALERLSDSTQASGTDWALGVEARSRALLKSGEVADALYCEAIERLDRTALRPDAARAHLLYGEWLRREGRRRDARDQLRTAGDRLEAMGMEGFAERARRELRATGGTARKRRVDTYAELTEQEAQVAKLAREGLSNPEIGTRLFISARTVQYHLGKVFTKLGITSRSQLEQALR
jgi:DNA-binding CsgD family transcriptional regulator